MTSRVSPSEERGFRGKASWAQGSLGLSLSLPSLVAHAALLARVAHQPQLTHSPLESSLFPSFPLLSVGHLPNFFGLF